MKTGRTITELAAELSRQQENKRDFIVSTSKLELIAGPQKGTDMSLAVNGEAMPLSRHTHGQIAGRLSEVLRKGTKAKEDGERVRAFGSTYEALREQHPDLLANLVNGIWGRTSEARMVRTLDKGARAFLSPRYRVIDNRPTLETAMEALVESGAQVDVLSCDVTDAKLYFKFQFPQITSLVAKGDIVSSGGVLTNSEIGSGAASLQPLIYRLVCTNGMIAGDKLSAYHIGRETAADGEIRWAVDTQKADNRAFLLRLRDTIRHMLNGEAFEKVVGHLRLATQQPVEARAQDAVEVAADRFGFNPDEKSSVLERFIQANDRSRWGFANAITRVAEDLKDYDRATEFEALGGKVIELKPEDWVAISHAGEEDPAKIRAAITDTRRIMAQAA